MKVTKTFDVTRCPQCPYFFTDHDMNATMHGCKLLGKGYYGVGDLFKNDSWKHGIYNKCTIEKER